MITGFNTDIEYEGVVYHVQTEDKGLESPIILSLVYSGGAILASKRSPYEDLIREGFSDEALSERLKRQHRLICAAIHTGRINDLKRMSARDPFGSPSEQPPVPLPSQDAQLSESTETSPVSTEPEFEFEIGEALSQKYQPLPIEEVEPDVEEEGVEEEQAEEEADQPLAEVVEQEESPVQRPTVGSYRISKKQPAVPPEPVAPSPTPPSPQPSVPLQQGLLVRLLDDVEFHSGDSPTIRVLVTNREGSQENPVINATVSVKVLGTTFRPLIYSLKTQRDGVASVATQIPQFTSGRAAVLIRAAAKEQSAEVRCIIHPKG